jgi:hypothetical protein
MTPLLGVASVCGTLYRMVRFFTHLRPQDFMHLQVGGKKVIADGAHHYVSVPD